MQPINDGYMMLLNEVKFAGKSLGYISEEGIDFGGDKPTYNSLFAAQVRTAPVKKVMAKPGTLLLSWQMIQLLADNMRDIAGGEVVGEVWHAPETLSPREGELEIVTGTGQTIRIKKATLSGVIRGKLGGSGNLYMETEAEMVAPTDKSSPFSIGPTAPGVSVDKEAISFAKGGGTQVVRVSASHPLLLSGSHSDFVVAQDGNFLVITAANNETSQKRTGSLTLTLEGHPDKKVTIALSQDK